MRDSRHRLVPSCIGVAIVAAGALPGAPCLAADGWRVTPSVMVRETITDNVALQPDDAKRSDFISEVMPGIQIDRNRGRLRVHLNYQADAIIHSRESSASEFQNNLDATVNFEAVEKFLFVDLNANIAQEVLSPFGPRPPSSSNITSNRTESRMFQLSPFIKGQIPSFADYVLRYRYSDFRSTGGSDSKVQEVTGTLTGVPHGRVTWSTDLLLQRNEFEDQRSTTLEHLLFRTGYAIYPELVPYAAVGVERTNFASLQKQTDTVYGAGVVWEAGPRTHAAAKWEHRFFGDSWLYELRQRWRRVIVTFTDTRDVSTNAQRLASRSSGGISFNLLFDALASRIPDPAERATEVQRLLREGGIPPDLNLPLDFLTNGTFVERRQELSAAVQGVRNTLVLTAFQVRRTEFADQIAGVPEQFKPDVKDMGGSWFLSHQLTGLTALAVGGDWYRTRDMRDAGSLQSEQWTGRLLLSHQFSPKTSGTLEYRYTRFNGNAAVDNYRENAVAASVAVQF